jgi:hypothetical protein
MITKHCVRFSLSLCPKQAKGVTGVQRHGDAPNRWCCKTGARKADPAL